MGEEIDWEARARTAEERLRGMGVHPARTCYCGGPLIRQDDICNATCTRCGARSIVTWPDGWPNQLRGRGR